MTDVHTLSTFEEALKLLQASAVQMGKDVNEMVAQASEVFLTRDREGASSLIEADLAVDQQKNALVGLTIQILARYQPVASDLRLVLAVEHIARDLERAADHAKNIAKRSLSDSRGTSADSSISGYIRKLHSAVQGMLTDALAAFQNADAVLAIEVSQRDHIPDAIYDDLFHAAIAHIQTDPSDAVSNIQALFVGKSLERIGDHATNIAEEVRFLARGDMPSATRTSLD